LLLPEIPNGFWLLADRQRDQFTLLTTTTKLGTKHQHAGGRTDRLRAAARRPAAGR
jgi:hypothetical protein